MENSFARRRRPSLATVLALLALMVAVGGTSYAAGKIDGKNLVNKSVAGKKLKADTVKGKQIKESTLGKVPSAASADTATTAETANLANSIAPDIVGNAELGTITLRSSSVDIAAGAGDIEDVDCLAGETRLGGGVFWQGVSWNNTLQSQLHVVYSQPDSLGWTGRGYNGTGATRTFVVQVLCLTP